MLWMTPESSHDLGGSIVTDFEKQLSYGEYPAHDEILAAQHLRSELWSRLMLTDQWSALAALTPSEYSQFWQFLATASGFPSHPYRAIELMLDRDLVDDTWVDGAMLPRFTEPEESQT